MNTFSYRRFESSSNQFHIFLTKLRPITSSSDLVSILIKVTHWPRKVSHSPPGNINNLSLTYFKSHGNMSCGDLRRINEPPVQLWCIFFARRRALDNKRELEQDESSLWSIWREAVRKITLRTASMKKSSSFLKKFPFPSWLRALEQDKLSPLQCHILCVRTCWRRHCHSVRTRVRAWPTVIAIMTQFESPRPRTPTFTFCLGCFAAISKEFREYASKLLERTMTQKGQRQIQTFAWR